MKIFALTILPILLYSSTLTKNLGSSTDQTYRQVNPNKPKLYLKTGPASTIYYSKTKLRPAVGLSYRAPCSFRYMDVFDISFSYSYQNVENQKRSLSIGEIFLPKASLLRYGSKEQNSSIYYGCGTGLYTSWQTETHAKSAYLLSSKDDNIYSIRSFFFFGSTLCAIIGYEMNRFGDISSGIQLEANTPLFSVGNMNTGQRGPLSIEISYIAGF